tara:strand:+ start:2855 stop:3550 length:696 start_codon:yes stop_codon:yes gene_type:complete
MIQNGVHLNNGNYHKMVGNGPPVIFSSGLFGTMPSFMYNDIIDNLKQNMTLILPSGNPIGTDTITEIANKLSVQKIGVITHSSFDYEILNNEVVEKAVAIDPVSFPQITLQSRSIKPVFDVLTFNTRMSQMASIPFIPNAFELNINTDDKILCEHMGHSDILDDMWADIADTMGIKGVTDISLNKQTFSDWKFLKASNKKEIRSEFRTMVCDKIRDFMLSTSHIFDYEVDE